MYKNVYGYTSPLLLLSESQNVTRILFIYYYFFYKYHIHFCFFYRCGLHLYIILKVSKSTNHIIFLDCLTGMKIVAAKNFDFQYSKNFLRIRFFGIWLKISIDLPRHII